MLILAERLVFRDAIAAGAARDIEIIHDHADSFSHADSGDHEIGATQAERRQTNQKRGQYGNGRPANKPEIRAVSGVHEQRSGVSAQPKENGESE